MKHNSMVSIQDDIPLIQPHFQIRSHTSTDTMHRVSSRRSRIFLKRRPLSCEVPSRRDSVGGGGSSRFFPWSLKADAIEGGGSTRNFPLMGPFYIFRLSQLNRPLVSHCSIS